MRLRPLSLILAFAAVLAAADPGSDWTSVRGNADLTGAATTPLPPGLVKAWTWDAESSVDGTVVIAGDAVYAATGHGVLARLDLATGKERWRLVAGPGYTAGPAISSGTLFIGDNGGELRAVDADTGKERWAIDLKGQINIGATAGSGVVLACTEKNRLFCVDMADGKQRWVFTSTNYIRATTALIGDEAVVAGCDGVLRALKLVGGASRTLADAKNFGAPPAHLGPNMIAGSVGSEVLSVALADGAPRWRRPAGIDQILVGPAVTATCAVFLGKSGHLIGLDPTTGAERWRTKLDSASLSAPAIAGDLVWIGADDGVLRAFDLATGTERWRWSAGGTIRSGPAIAGGYLVIGTRDGAVHALRAPAKP